MYGDPFPTARPPGLRRRAIAPGTDLWRIDTADPAEWDWSGWSAPRSRFDPTSGAFRTRYASTSLAGATRERYLDSGRMIPADHADHYLVHLIATRTLRVLDLRTQRNLDALDIDDRVSTSHDKAVWDTCHHLADAARGWWDDGLDGIVYRSRTTPQQASNVAFFALHGLDSRHSRPLHSCHDELSELSELIVHHRFTIRFSSSEPRTLAVSRSTRRRRG